MIKTRVLHPAPQKPPNRPFVQNDSCGVRPRPNSGTYAVVCAGRFGRNAKTEKKKKTGIRFEKGSAGTNFVRRTVVKTTLKTSSFENFIKILPT